METAVLSDSKDRTALSLAVDQLASSSPFPSPSSSFIPPPVPGTHEFAVPSPLAGRGKKVSNAKKDPEEITTTTPNTAAPSENITNGEENILPAPIADSPTENPSTPHPVTVSPVFTPDTPTPSSGFQTQPQVSPEATATTAPIASTIMLPTTPTSPSHHFPRDPITSSPQRLRDSLISNRPAPPSPESSHRVSGAPSVSSNRSRSGKSSRPPSTALSRTNSTRMNTRQSFQLALSANSQASSASATRRAVRSLTIKIRDFAFPSHDERHEGRGPDVPRPNRVRTLNRHLTGGSVSSVTSSEGEDDGAEEDDGWSGFKWGFGAFTWAPGRVTSGGGGSSKADGYVPSNTDFARNFGAGAGGVDESEGVGVDGDGDLDVDGDVDEGYEDNEEDVEGDRFLLDEPLYPGLYRAMYAFVPEGTSEMALEEDQIVRVVGRGGGVGWAVVVRGGEGEDGGHALVPESYLEVVQLDDSEGEGDGEAKAEVTSTSISAS